MKNLLYYGDNLEVLRDDREFPDACVDLVYLDPPFNSDATYNVLFDQRDGSQAAAQMRAFEDTWRWDEAAVRAFKETVEEGGPVAEALTGLRSFLGDSNMMAYLSMMAPRLLELHRVLRPEGLLWLHCDPTASHYLRVLLDGVFSAACFFNEVIWERTVPKSLQRVRLPNNHDVLLVYGRTENATMRAEGMFEPYDEDDLDPKTAGKYSHRDADGRRYQLTSLINPNPDRPNLTYEFLGITRTWRWTKERMQQAWEEGHIVQPGPGKVPRLKRYLDEQRGRPLGSVWSDIPPINARAAERLHYPTQKPEALLERILTLSSDRDGVVLDPFCGCGTTVSVAHRLGRRWIGIDITHLAIGLMKHRLKDTFGDEVEDAYDVRGEPADVEGARYLAEADRYQFEWWALGLVGARRNEKKGADRGVDGVIWFHDERGESRKVVLQVKSGKVGTPVLKEFRQTVEEQGAALGVLLTLDPATKPTRAAAADAGTYESGWGSHPRIQILTVGELLEGARIDMPPMGTRTTYRSAPRYEPVAADEPSLFDER